MALKSYVNVARFALGHPRRSVVMARKVATRLRESDARNSENLRWLAAHAEDPSALAQRIAPELWTEALAFGDRLRARAEPILAQISYDTGAGGDYEFLYWLTRLRKPEVVVETGVSAGWTSQAFLEALERNGTGRLYSSDFPLFKAQDPEALIGCVVEPRLRERWTLMIEGDAVNLPRILNTVTHVDLFHYDSDKSYSGRDLAVRLVRRKLAANGLIVMDDVRNNPWFYDHATRGRIPYRVLGDGGRYGMLGQL